MPLHEIPADIQAQASAALQVAIGQVAANREAFRHVFPDDTTTHQEYKVLDLPDFGPGVNAGWTSGLWTGQVWLAYEVSGDEGFRSVAQDNVLSFADRLAQKRDLTTHDLGFLYTPSCVAAYRLTGSPVAKDAALQAADALMVRYLAKAGVIQAWGDLNDPALRGRMIVDCLMNLPLLRWASAVTGNPAYRQAADTHCQRARQVLVRPDASTFHTYHFDPETGAPLRGTTHQGFSDDSCWARGQAWGIYGFALNHRYAPELGLLDTSVRLADYFLAHLPDNGVAYWDLIFGKESTEPWDSSASAIAVCGLLELAEMLPPGAQSEHYHAQALRILQGLITHCAGHPPATRAVLQHGVYHRGRNHGVDEANLWGDFFFIEALARVAHGWTPYWHPHKSDV